MVKKKMKTKAIANTILEKKLEELECLLKESGSGNGDDINAYPEIKFRLIFMQTLLAAEILSAKDGEDEKSLKLRCMAKRLIELKDAFKELTGPFNELDMQSLESGDVNVDNDDETGSVWSLVEMFQEEYQGTSLEKQAERKIEKIKKKRFRGMVSFGIVGFVAGLVSLYGYVCDQMNGEAIFLSPT